MPPRRSRTFAAVNYGYGFHIPNHWAVAGKQALVRGRTRDPLHGGVAIGTIVASLASILGPAVMGIIKSLASNLSTSVASLVKDPRKLMAVVTKFAPHISKVVKKALEILHIKKPKPTTIDPGEMPTEPVRPVQQPVSQPEFDPSSLYNHYVKPSVDPYLQQIKQQIQQTQQWQQWQSMLQQMNNPQMKINPYANYFPDDNPDAKQNETHKYY